ncbi:hypothetical protein, partial [Trichococcus sp.]|uniref:hypothetical protein n=1 Tax=Trichococcus sp. TaxID=1985464 RepID=UPI003C7B9A2B
GRGFSSGEGPLAGGALKKSVPPPSKPVSPEVSIQNVGRTPAKPAFTGGKKNARKRYSGTAPACDKTFCWIFDWYKINGF